LGLAGSLPRPNGPFGTNDSLALIGLVIFFLLLFLRNLLGERLSFWRRIVHGIGLTASLAMALMPMFRSVGISLMVILLIATLSTRRPSRRILGFALLLFCLGAVSLVSILAPDTYADRSDPGNVYGRVAEQIQTWHLFSSHPLLGVGLGHFADTVNGDTHYYEFYNGIRSLDSPHNSLGGILAETGILGFIPYVAAQGMLFLAFWRLRKRRDRNAQLAWTYFLYIFLSYWISGLSLQSGYSSDLNLWFIFSITILYKISMSEKPLSGLDGIRTKTVQECCI
jgi:O-antigen ligase